jgi:hypothetical protein
MQLCIEMMDLRIAAQIFNLLYRRFLTCKGNDYFQACADWKSALQQITNLRHLPDLSLAGL